MLESKLSEYVKGKIIYAAVTVPHVSPISPIPPPNPLAILKANS